MTDEQIIKREETIQIYIRNFLDNKNIQEEAIVDVNLAAKSIVSLYERYTEEIVRRAILSTNGTIHHFKIIANTELCVLRICPIEIPTNKQYERRLNAELAFNIGLNILLEWNEWEADSLTCLGEVLKSDSDLKEFQEEHLNWLYLIDTRVEFPIFCNSQVWRLFYYLLRDRVNIEN